MMITMIIAVISGNRCSESSFSDRPFSKCLPLCSLFVMKFESKYRQNRTPAITITHKTRVKLALTAFKLICFALSAEDFG